VYDAATARQEEGERDRRRQFSALMKDLEGHFLSHEAQREESFHKEEAQQVNTSQVNELERNRQFGESEASREHAFQHGQEMRLEKSNWYAKARDELVEFNRKTRDRGCNKLEADVKSCFSTILRSQEVLFTKEESLRDEFVDKIVSPTSDIYIYIPHASSYQSS
jgi:hypothetical protein